MSDVTRLLSQINDGDPEAAEQLLPLVYEELRHLAAVKMAQEKPGQTLQATALVHEAYLRLVDVQHEQHWHSRGHFFCAAAEAMRRVLIDAARRRKAEKRGGGRRTVDIAQVECAIEPPAGDLLTLNEALADLERKDKLKADVVKLRFFAGLTVRETAAALGLSLSTADNYWAYARAWLRVRLSEKVQDDG